MAARSSALPLGLLLGLLLAACGDHREPDPITLEAIASESGSEGEAEPPPSAARVGLMAEVERLHGRCAATRAVLERRVQRAQNRETGETVVAIAAILVGESADGDTGPEEAGRPFPEDPDEACRPGDCEAGAMPGPVVGEPSPAQRRVEDRRVDASTRVREMDLALEALDELLFAHPEPTTWSDEERASFQALRRQVVTACAE